MNEGNTTGRWPGAASVRQGTGLIHPAGPFGVELAEFLGVELTPSDDDLRVESLSVPGYERLASALRAAYRQAAIGKGKERHANDLPFHEQPMQDLIRLNGLGYATGQAGKKASEARGFMANADKSQCASAAQRAIFELYGAIVYLAGAIIALEDAEETRA